MNIFAPNKDPIPRELLAFFRSTSKSKVKFDLVYDVNLILGEPYKICFVEHWSGDPEKVIREWSEEYQNLDFSIFDLVIIVDPFCWHNNELIQSFVQQNGIKNYLLLTPDNESTIDEAVFYPYFLLHVLNHNEFSESNHYLEKPFLFDALLGSPRTHRSYVMKRFQHNEKLLAQSVVTYRDNFRSPEENSTAYVYSCRRLSWLSNLATETRTNEIWFPYTSAGYQLVGKYDTIDFDTAAELNKQTVTASLKDSIGNIFKWADSYNYDISKHKLTQLTDSIITAVMSSQRSQHSLAPNNFAPVVPWKIYANTWYSIIAETESENVVSVTEKIGRAFFAKRIFILFGAAGSLTLLKQLGFKTFDCVIDETYDTVQDHVLRWKMAFDQVEKLAKLDPRKIYDQTEEIREHNFNRLREYYLETQNKVQNLIWYHVAYGPNAIRMMHALHKSKS